MVLPGRFGRGVVKPAKKYYYRVATRAPSSEVNPAGYPQPGYKLTSVDTELPLALVTVEGGGAEVIPVTEVDGVLVDRRTGVEIDLVSLVVVVGLPELVGV